MTDDAPHPNSTPQLQYEAPLPSVHCNSLNVQVADCIYLHFYQIRPPFLPNQPPIAAGVASVAVSVDQMQDFINIIQQQLHLAMMKADVSPLPGGRFTFPDSGLRTDDHSDDEFVSGADLSMEEFDVTERDADFVKSMIASRMARPKFPLPENAIGIQ